MNVATAVECLELLPKPYEKMKHIPNFVPELILHDMARKGLVKIVGTVSILCVIYDESEGFLDDNFEKVPQKLRDFFGTRFPVKMKGNVRVKSIMHVESDSSYWDEVDEILKYERENYCPNGHALCFCGSNNIRYVDKPPLYRMTGKGLDFMNQAERFTGDMEVKEALKILESKTPTVEPSATDTPAPAEATATPTGGKKKASKKQAARDVPDIEELLPHVEPFSLDSGQWVKTKDVGTPGEVTLRGCRDLKKRTGRDGLVYGVDNFGRIYCMAPKCYYYRPTMTPASRAFKKFYAGVRMTEA